jgi:M6 family metalloprotease-like protein
MTRRWVRRLVPLGVVLAAGLLLHAAEPPAPPAPDLSEFHTVDNAVTTHISKAAPNAVAAQPAYLGVNLDVGLKGAVVAQVEADSPAARAGLQVGDVVRTVDGKAVVSPADVRDLLSNKAPGDGLAVVVARKDKDESLSVTLTAVSHPLTAGQRAIIGVQMGQAEGDGAKIDVITPGKPAAEAGLKPGDVILKVNEVAIHAADQLGNALADHKPGDVVGLVVLRGKTEFGVLTKLAADSPGGRFRGWDDRQPSYFTKDAYHLAVVPVEFADIEHNAKVTQKDWEKALFSKGDYTDKSPTGQQVYGSLNDYYLEQSCGAFHVEGKVFDWVKVEKKRKEYGDDANRFNLLNEALDKLEARDKDALKDFDGVFFLYAGERAQTQRGGLYWPHKANVNHNGKRWNYFICPEGGEKMASISVVAHEFGHMLGLPDLYAQPDVPNAVGLGIWCTMSTGHGQDGKPLHFSAWCKEQLGWLKPAVIDPTVKQKLVIAPVENSPNQCYKVLIKPDGSEYLLLENRVKKDFDRDLPGEGLLIWRVSDGRPVLEESHGITTPDGVTRFLGSIPYPSKSNNAFTPTTTPSSKSPSGGGLPVHITNIQRLPDGRITFFIGYEYL